MVTWWQRLMGDGEDLSQYPDWYRRYREGFRRLSQDTPVSQVSFVVFDTETTGLKPKEDRLLSIGAVSVANNVIHAGTAFGCYLNPELAHSKTEAVPIHGLLPNSNRQKYLTEMEAVVAFFDWLPKDAVLVAHHLSFDRQMMDAALSRLGAGSLPHSGVDTFYLAQQLQPKSYWQPDDAFSLDHLARQYRIPLSDRHTALGDSYITAVLLLKLLHRLEDRKDRELRLGDLL